MILFECIGEFMLGSLRSLIVVSVLALGSWIGWKSYNYYFDNTIPAVEIIGFAENNYQSGDMHLLIKGGHSYKVSTISIWLDGKSLNSDHRVNRSSFERPLQIPTTTLANGKHTLKISLTSGSRQSQTVEKEYTFFVDNLPLQAALIQTDHQYKVFQGRTLHVQIQTNKIIKKAYLSAFAKEYDCVQENENSTIYECFIPVGCEETPNEYPFVLTVEDYVGQRTILDGALQVMAFPFKKQVLHSINQSVFENEKKLGKTQQEFGDLMEKAAKESPRKKLWKGSFYVPLNMTAVTCDFGVKRVSQERGCYIHAALDLVGPSKCVVWSDADGIVICKDRYEITGNTVVIDHGWGVISFMCHLDSFADIEVGQFIKRGQPLGKMGKTGYATGDHLHWEIRVNNIQVDPMQWTKNDF